jgi:hypothetical protein
MTEEFGFDSHQVISYFYTTSRATSGPTQAPIHWAAGALSPAVKGRGAELPDKEGDVGSLSTLAGVRVPEDYS